MAGGTMAPFGIDTTVPSTARMYDWWLGGHDNFAADRAAALAVSQAAPEAQLMAVENRKFLRRAVRYLVPEAGITQFLDIGTGRPPSRLCGIRHNGFGGRLHGKGPSSRNMNTGPRRAAQPYPVMS